MSDPIQRTSEILLDEAQAIKALEGNPEYRVLKRFQPVERYSADSHDICLGLVVDTETTGLEADADIIEIGAVLFSYSLSTKAIHAIVDTYSALEDPGYPIPEESTLVTGITSVDVAGKTIDWGRVAGMVEKARVAIAHKADFDRPLLETRCGAFAGIPWACSLKDIDWAALGMGTSKLDYIAFRLGFFFDGHRAENDCRALLHALTCTFPGASTPLSEMLIRGAAQSSFRVWAVGAPFEVKDTLKARGYRWNDGSDGRPKAWHKDVHNRALLESEHVWLKEKIYTRAGDGFLTIPVEALSPKVRYSTRRGDVMPMADILSSPAQTSSPGPAPVAAEPPQFAPTPAPITTPASVPSVEPEQGSLWGDTAAAKPAAPRRG